jgi:site-specific DNA recombinase
VRAVGYTRVSTDKQAASGLSLDAQEARIRAYAQAKGWEFIELFAEKGVSGRKDSRPELDALLSRLDEFDAVIVPKIDRFGRGGLEQAIMLKRRLDEANVKLIFLEPEIDFDTLAGRIVFAIMVEIARAESINTGERIAAAAEQRAIRGRFTGRIPPYGYVKGEDGLEPDAVEREIVVRIFHALADGTSSFAVARALNADGVPTRRGGPWRPAAVWRIGHNPVYVGKVRLNDVVYDGQHEAIVPMDLWDRVQALRGDKRGRRPAGTHLFTKGLLRCAHCGSGMVPRSDSDTYRCSGRHEHGPDFCPQIPIPRESVDQSALRYFEHVGLNVEETKERLSAQFSARLTEATALRDDEDRTVKQAGERLNRIRNDYLDGVIDAAEWRTLSEQIRAERDAAERRLTILSERIEKLHEADPASAAAEAFERRIAELRAAVAGQIAGAAGLDEVRAKLRTLFDKFDIGRTDLPPDEDMPLEMRLEREEALAEARASEWAIDPSWVMWPWSKPEMFEGLEDEWPPVLTMSTSARERGHCWFPIAVGASRSASGLPPARRSPASPARRGRPGSRRTPPRAA